jgi:hypothetical protein
VTLAPFVAVEKPDLSPAAAISFSKDKISYTRAVGEKRERDSEINLRAKPRGLEIF